jgi:hypothetical protein
MALRVNCCTVALRLLSERSGHAWQPTDQCRGRPMSEVVQLLPESDPERDEKIFKDWRTGKRTIVQLARDHDLPQSQVTAILDRYLPSLTPKAQLRELRRLLFDLEELREVFHDVSLTHKDPEAAHVAVRTAHEIAQLRMFVGGSAHNDPIQLQRAADPQTQTGSVEAYEKVLARLPKRTPE